jgi:hypothetical protein
VSESAANAERAPRSRLVIAILIAGVILTVVVLALLLVTEIPKWTCDPPHELWVEAPDRCIGLP